MPEVNDAIFGKQLKFNTMLKLNPLLFCVLLLFIIAWKVSDTIGAPVLSSLKVIHEDKNSIPKDSL